MRKAPDNAGALKTSIFGCRLTGCVKRLVLLRSRIVRAFSSSVAFILRDAMLRMAPQDEVLSNPHGEERGNAARLEPRGPGCAIKIRSNRNTL